MNEIQMRQFYQTFLKRDTLLMTGDRPLTSRQTTSDPKALKEAEETIKDYSSPYKSSSNGSMLILPFLISASFAFFYLVLFMV